MKKLTYAGAINEAIREEMLRDEKVFFMGEDIGVYHEGHGPCGVSTGLLDEFGFDRIIETPIAESVIVGSGVGAAMVGLRPVVELMHSEFACCAFEHIVYGGCKGAVKGNGRTYPLVIRMPYGGVNPGSYVQDESVESWFHNTPGLKIVAPSDANDAKGMLISAIRDDYPVLFLEHKGIYKTVGEVTEGEYTVPLNKAKILREGSDVTVLTFGNMVYKAMDAAEELAATGVSVEVVDLRSLLPLDEETIAASVAKTGRVIVFHEARKTGGIGGEISALVAEKCFADLKAPIHRLGGPDVPANFPQCAANLVKEVNAIMGYGK